MAKLLCVRRYHASARLVILGLPLLLVAGCPPTTPNDDANLPIFNNDSDPTNGGASYIGSSACGACHPSIAETNRIHAHSHALTAIRGQAPMYAAQGTRAGVPDAPAGFAWTDISYVISGYLHGAFFVDSQGYVMTTGVDGVDTEYLLDFPPNGTTAGFVPYLPSQGTPKPFDYETCFRCHTTGPEPQDPANPLSQDGRPGILGTWAEENVTCEACHGPGSRHAPNPQTRNIFVDPTAATCGRCHTEGGDPNVIVAKGVFANGNTQYPQLLASGGHSRFSCTVCHDPHASVTYDRSRGLRNDCTVCHGDQNMAFHAGLTYEIGRYSEALNCQSCHMPLLGLSSSTADPNVVGPTARVGDVRGHIFRINTIDADVAAFLTTDGSAVRKDDQGRAAATVDYVCLRCHNGGGNAFPLLTEAARTAADGMHTRAAQE